MRRGSFILALSLCFAAQPQPCLGNPDGPVGSICIVPQYSQSNPAYLWNVVPSPYVPYTYIYDPKEPHRTEWSAGADALVPVFNFLTVGVGFAKHRGPEPTGYVGYGSDRVLLGNRTWVSWSVSARVYIPFTSRARDQLARQ